MGVMLKRRFNAMNSFYPNIEIENLANKRALSVQARVQSGDVFLAIPQALAKELGLDLEESTAGMLMLPNGRRKRGPVVGNVRVTLGNRQSDLSAVVQGNELVLSGVAPTMLARLSQPA